MSSKGSSAEDEKETQCVCTSEEGGMGKREEEGTAGFCMKG